jgi:predicted phage tail protein
VNHQLSGVSVVIHTPSVNVHRKALNPFQFAVGAVLVGAATLLTATLLAAVIWAVTGIK